MVLKSFGLALVTLVAAQKPPEPDEALRRSLERKPACNMEAFVESSSAGGGTMRFRMWRDTSGRRRTEVLYPIAMQGRILIDDGVSWITYFPDTKTLRVHPSPSSEQDDLDQRMRLIRRNYALEVDSKVTVAGRSAIRLVAKPRFSDLQTQRFYLDSSNFTPLKIESVDDLGNVTVQFAVRRIDYPAKLEKEIFDAPNFEGMKREMGRPPIPAKQPEEIERRLGFRPALPERLPRGFRKIGVDLLDWRGVNPVAIRLTDGLVKLYVLQFKISNLPPKPPRPGEEPKVCKDVGDIRVEVRGDGPIAVRERILAEFVHQLEKRAKAQDP